MIASAAGRARPGSSSQRSSSPSSARRASSSSGSAGGASPRRRLGAGPVCSARPGHQQTGEQEGGRDRDQPGEEADPAEQDAGDDDAAGRRAAAGEDRSPARAAKPASPNSSHRWRWRAWRFLAARDACGEPIACARQEILGLVEHALELETPSSCPPLEQACRRPSSVAALDEPALGLEGVHILAGELAAEIVERGLGRVEALDEALVDGQAFAVALGAIGGAARARSARSARADACPSAGARPGRADRASRSRRAGFRARAAAG